MKYLVPAYALSTQFGKISLRIEDDHVVALRIIRSGKNDCSDFIGGQRGQSLPALVEGELREYFEGQRTSFSFPIHCRGTAFERQIWNIVSSIPYGAIVPYQSVAMKLGAGRASVEDVRIAIEKNPIAIAIPCHRVRLPTGSCANEISEQRIALRALERGGERKDAIVDFLPINPR